MAECRDARYYYSKSATASLPAVRGFKLAASVRNKTMTTAATATAIPAATTLPGPGPPAAVPSPVPRCWPHRNLLTEYTANSTIHGVKYLGSPDRPWPERVWWIVVFIVSISMCGALIANTYKKWTSDPVIVTFSQMATPVWHIPFPAVTICPTNLVRQSTFNFTDLLTKIQDKGVNVTMTAFE